MIHYFAPRSLIHHSMMEFLNSWGREFVGTIQPRAYPNLFRLDRLQSGTCIFTHFEAFTPLQLKLVADLYRRLAQLPASFRVMNDPSKFLDRSALLDALHRNGINSFRAVRLDQPVDGLKFPVFVRLADEHFSFDAPLLHSFDELREQTEALLRASDVLSPHDLLATEHYDVSDHEGRYRKYSAMRIGDRIIPRHVFSSHNWLTKFPDIIDEQAVGEELEFVDAFPHEALLRPVFDLAGVDYGRIDYAFLGDQLCVWEINTNPVIVPAPDRTDPRRLTSQERSAAMVIEAFRELETTPLVEKYVSPWNWTERRDLKAALSDVREDITKRRSLIQVISDQRENGK